MEKPKKPIEPIWKDYPSPKESNAQNYEGKPLFVKTEYIADAQKYRTDLIQYRKDCETYEQMKTID